MMTSSRGLRQGSLNEESGGSYGLVAGIGEALPTAAVDVAQVAASYLPLDRQFGTWAPAGMASPLSFGFTTLSAGIAPAAATPIGTGIGTLNVEAVRNQARIKAFITDDLVDEQWHLGFLGDMAAIWHDYTGKGVSVGVYDSGVDTRLSGLAANYDAGKEVVVGGKKYDGSWRPVSGPHGTAVAGLIAAANDGNETVGVAYSATITGVNIFDPYSGGKLDPGIYINASDDTRFIEAMRQGARFDIINNSWGPDQPVKSAANNRMVEGSRADKLVDAIASIAATGRGGLGTVAVKAAGNYGNVFVFENNSFDPKEAYGVDGETDSASTDRHWISVGAYRQVDGNASSYSTRGAHLLISAPSDDYTEMGGTGVWTTDAKGRDGYVYAPDPGGDIDFTDSFGGTSAATPIVSGVIALMMDANAQLGWRDVKDILAASAKMPVSFATGATSLPVETTFGFATAYLNEDRFKITGDGSSSRVNNGGYHYSTDYGYGAINGFGAVRMAEVWSLFGPAKTSANEVNFSVERTVNAVLPDAVYVDGNVVTTPVSFFIDVDRDIEIEHLDLVYSYTDTSSTAESSASLTFTVTSPDGTSYYISARAVGGLYGENGTSITEVVGLAGLRGETTSGRWTVAVADASPSAELMVQNLSLRFSGSETSENNVYHITDEFLTMLAIPGEAAKRGTIVDRNGGTDWIDMSALTGDGQVDLANGKFYLAGRTFNITGAIENVVGGDGQNYLSGSDQANRLYGMRGNDTIYALDGDDWIDGGTGNDTVYAGDGMDSIYFDLTASTGYDSIADFMPEDWLVFNNRLPGDKGDGVVSLDVISYGGNVTESVLRTDNISLGSRISLQSTRVDRVYLAFEKDGNYYYSSRTDAALTTRIDVRGSNAADTLVGNDLNNVVYGLGGSDRLFGAAGHDTLFGGAGDDRLYGGAGDDRLDGGVGIDVLDGGTGNDTYFVDQAADIVIEYTAGGSDTVYAGINYTLTANVENLYVSGAARIGTGNALDNGLYGTNFGDTLYGLDGNDLLKGWGGDDALYGGAGTDRLEGAEGNDRLDGGAGADAMEGSVGNDTYVVDNAGDTVTEWYTNGQGGTDSVYASVDWTLGNNVENLFLTGSTDLNGTGNALANTVRGNSGANVLRGGAGNDTLFGLGGNDTLFGGAGADTFVFGASFGKDTIRDFGAGDTISLSGYQLDTDPVVSDLGMDTLIDLGGGNTILLTGVDPNQLSFTGNAFGFAG